LDLDPVDARAVIRTKLIPQRFYVPNTIKSTTHLNI